MVDPRKEFGADLYNIQSIRNNADVINYLRTSGSIVAGVTLGILGVTGWIGFAYYLLMHLLVAGLLYTKATGSLTSYHPTSSGLLTAEVFGQTSILTFILFWTISNNLVHLF